MKGFLDFLVESDRQFQYRIKTVVPVSDEAVEKIKRVLEKYELRSISSVKKTILQERPLDFVDVGTAEVYIIDVSTGVPVSSYILQQNLREVLEVNEKYLIVRGANEPLEIEARKQEAIEELDAEARKKGLSKASLLDTSSTYTEASEGIGAEDLFGTKYNSVFLNTLAKVAANRSDKEPAPFSWLKTHINTEASDANYPETGPAVTAAVPWWKANRNLDDPKEVVNVRGGAAGNFDDEGAKISKIYTDKSGKRVVLSKTIGNMRDS